MIKDGTKAILNISSNMLSLEKEHLISSNAKRCIEEANAEIVDFSKQGHQELSSIKLNIINRKKYPYEALKARYDLDLDKKQFSRKKIKYAKSLSKKLGLLKNIR